MCEQCSAKTVLYGELLTGWYLVRATQDGLYMKKDEWGLVECNDPTFSFMTTPVIDPFDGMSDEEINKVPIDEFFKKHDPFVEVSKKVLEEMERTTGFPLDSFGRLYQSMREAGFDQEHCGAAIYWLCNLMAKMIRDNPNPIQEH